MKRILTVLIVMMIAIAGTAAQEKEHSLEITTGYPSILFELEFPWMNSRVEINDIGIKFGKGKVYGIVEANISPATTFGMAGVGIRL